MPLTTIEQFCEVMMKQGNTVLQFRCIEHYRATTVCFLDAKTRQMVVTCAKCERPIAYADLKSIPRLTE